MTAVILDPTAHPAPDIFYPSSDGELEAQIAKYQQPDQD
jgi:hypothetical protein